MFNYRWREHYQRTLEDLNSDSTSQRTSLSAQELRKSLGKKSDVVDDYGCYKRNMDKVDQMYRTIERMSPKLFERMHRDGIG
jgi:hypothetical protein